MENKKVATVEMITPECSAILPYGKNKVLEEESEYLQSTLPYCVRRFDFFFDQNNQMDMTIHMVELGDKDKWYHVQLNGQSRERIMRENRQKVLNHKPFSEYVRFYKVVNKSSETEWIGASVFDLMFLTLNSRSRVKKELQQVRGIKKVKLSVICKRQKRRSLILSIKDTIKFICSMSSRLLERKIMKDCLVEKIIPLSQLE
jgi:hypothetical protein